MCQKTKIITEGVDVIYKDGIVYVPFDEYVKLVSQNVLLQETLKNTLSRGQTVEARKLCGLNEARDESRPKRIE